MGDVYNLLCLRSIVWFKEPVLFQNICGDASRVEDCWSLAKTRDRK